MTLWTFSIWADAIRCPKIQSNVETSSQGHQQTYVDELDLFLSSSYGIIQMSVLSHLPTPQIKRSRYRKICTAPEVRGNLSRKFFQNYSVDLNSHRKKAICKFKANQLEPWTVFNKLRPAACVCAFRSEGAAGLSAVEAEEKHRSTCMHLMLLSRS